MCCKTGEFSSKTAKQLEITTGNDTLGKRTEKEIEAWRAKRSKNV
ncbi:hypothetical protein CEV33_4539 [Brucella grignonensis]|uniref:Uncharacterized protein n=1 Tax=Brucella grignonensis TaxID=94627 RepID=A0A256GML2_9HYPH|nr:hypothetical protein CEV33_4539 [Brucella grignonensis]